MRGNTRRLRASRRASGRRSSSRRARGTTRLREIVALLEEAGALWWPAEAGWPTVPLSARDTRAIVSAIVCECDKRWHGSDGWDWYPGADLIDCAFQEIISKPIPRRILEGLAAGGLVRLIHLHGLTGVDE